MLRRVAFIAVTISALILTTLPVAAADGQTSTAGEVRSWFHSAKVSRLLAPGFAPGPAGLIMAGEVHTAPLCGDGWHVLAATAIGLSKREARDFGMTVLLDAADVPKTVVTPIRFADVEDIIGYSVYWKRYGKFLPPGSLSEGAHTTTLILDPPGSPPVEVFGSFTIDDSAC